jgi:hypothetical protein
MLKARTFRLQTSRTLPAYLLCLRRGQTGGAGQRPEISSEIAARRPKADTGVAASAGSRKPFDNPLGRSIAALVLLWLYFTDTAGRALRVCWRLEGGTK